MLSLRILPDAYFKETAFHDHDWSKHEHYISICDYYR